MEKLLFEIGTEEIPAKFMPAILTQLHDMAAARLHEQRISFETLRVFGTPRRMAFLAEGVKETQEDSVVESKGPAIKIAFGADGTPSKAAMGFARGQKVEVGDLVEREGYVYAVKHLAGKDVSELLPALLSDIIHSLSFPKTMRWADYDFRFVRPIRWLVALFGDRVIPVEITGIHSGNVTMGHRFMSNGPAVVPTAGDYEKVLEANSVIVDQDKRRELIKKQVEEVAAAEGGYADITADLLEEIVYLVEYPTALCGHFDEVFLSLPKEAVITPMREHQRYFPVLDAQGKLLNKFITVRNGGSEHIEVVAHGNERVLRARLSDARFFFDEDRKKTLSQWREKLKTVVFQEGLGNMYEKGQRLENIANAFLGSVRGNINQEDLSRAALLAKADLVTGMVCEFTELQGVMGREYALLDGEKPAVAKAICEHYQPRFAGDELPQTTMGRILSLSDKLDNIAATFSRGLAPTGSQDPYALRRQALGVLNIALDAQWHFSLKKALAGSLLLLKIDVEDIKKIVPNIMEFFRQRIKNMLIDKGVRYDVVDAVLADQGNDDVTDIFARAEALSAYIKTSAAADSIQAFTRVDNICKKLEIETAINTQLFQAPEEKALHDVVMRLHKEAIPLLMVYDYAKILCLSDELAIPVNAFFDAVMVMDKDERVKENRLALLGQVKEMANMVGALNCIVL